MPGNGKQPQTVAYTTPNYHSLAAAASSKRATTPLDVNKPAAREKGKGGDKLSREKRAQLDAAAKLQPCIAQVFIQLTELPPTRTALGLPSPKRSTAQSSGAPASLAKDAVDFAQNSPQIVRLNGADTAAATIEKALASYFVAAAEHLRKLREASSNGPRATSPLTSPKKNLRGAKALSNSPKGRGHAMLPGFSDAAAGGSHGTGVSDSAAEPLWEELLPSRLLDDYALYVADVDGTLPMVPLPTTTAAAAAVPPALAFALSHDAPGSEAGDGSAHPQQQKQLTPDEARAELALRMLAPDALVRLHPKSSFPFTYRLVYAPMKGKSRAVPPVVAVAAASNVTSPSNAAAGGATISAIQKFIAAAAITSPSRALQMDDDVARSRGFTPLAFLPPQGAVAPAPSQPQQKADQQGQAKGAVAADDLDEPLDAFMRDAGLTLYDVAQYGHGPLAAHGKDFCRAEAIRLTREEINIRREANVTLAERRQARREAQRLEECGERAMSLREEVAARLRAQAERDARTTLEQALINDTRVRAKAERELDLRMAIDAHKEAVRQQLRADSERRAALEAEVLARLVRREEERHERTTLRGEAEAFEREARRAGPMVMQLNSHRPQLRKLDQDTRQARLYDRLVNELDAAVGRDESSEVGKFAAAAEARRAQNMVAEETTVVRAQERAAALNKQLRRGERHANDERQQQQLQQVSADSRFALLLRKPDAPYRTIEETGLLQQVEPSARQQARAQVEAQQRLDEQQRFVEWRQQREAHQSALCARRELMLPRRERPVPDTPFHTGSTPPV